MNTTHQLTHYRWLDIVLGLAGGFALTAVMTVCFAAWYLDHLGVDSPILWDGYSFWFGALALSLLPVAWLRDRTPTFAGALLTGVCGSSLLLVIVLWLLDNGIGFSA
jgi:hypothetical protein